MAINRHGISKDATKAELKKIRSNPNSSKGAKNLAHWKLNMHHNKESIEDFGESLKDWFGKGKKGDWVRVGTDGKIKGQCAREPGEGKPKCMPRSKAHSMDKKDRASAARRKRAKDPSVDRPGTGNKPINVKTQKEELVRRIQEKCWQGYTQKGMKKKGNRIVPNCVKETKEYDATPGGMEWGTDKGDDYYRKITPGQEPKRRDLKGNKTTIKPVKVPFNPAYTTEEMTPAEKSKHEYPIDNKNEAPDIDEIMVGKEGSFYIDDKDVQELEKQALEFSFDDAIALGLYDQDELEYEDYDGDKDPFDDHEIEITEALSVQGRLKRRFAAKRNKQKLKVARRIAMRRGSTPDRLKRRAVRGARLMVYKRLLRGRDRSSLPPAEKGRLERMIQRFQPLVSRISVKLLPQMRKNEIARLTKRGKQAASRSKKFKMAKPIAKKQTAKKFKAKGAAKVAKPKKPKKFTPKKPNNMGTKAYKAFSYSVG